MAGWHVYSPCWAPVSVVNNAGRHYLELRDADPYDYARAVRIFPASQKLRAELEVQAVNEDSYTEIELCDSAGNIPVKIILDKDQNCQTVNSADTSNVGKYKTGIWTKLILTIDLTAGEYSVQLNGNKRKTFSIAERNFASLERLSIRTGPWRGSEKGPGAQAIKDVPAERPIVVYVDNVTIDSK